jgi:hypothetical protein
VPPDGKIEDVFVEGPGMWSFGKPPGAAGRRHLLAQHQGQRPAQGRGRPDPFIVTLRGRRSVETRLELDIPAAKP